MSTPVAPVVAVQASPAAAGNVSAAPVKLTAIQVIEQELQGWLKQSELAAKNAEQAIANNHAIQGAIQGAQQLLAKLKAEEAKAMAFAKAEAEKAVTAVEKL